MSSPSLSILEDRLEQLQEFAARFGVTTEDLVRFSIEEILSQPDEARRLQCNTF